MTNRLRRPLGRFVRKHPRLLNVVGRARRLRRAWPEPPPRKPIPPRRRVELLLPRLGQEPRAALMVAPSTMYIPKKLVKSGMGGYEPDALACFLAVMDMAPPGPVWDVGANVGIYGLIARAANDREVIAFEPTPDLAQVARSAAEQNGLPYRVMEVALAEQTGEMTFYLSDVTDSSNSLKEGFRKSSNQLTVTVDTADHLIESGELRPPAVMKIDTETTEPAVIHGALGLIRDRRPWMLCEILAKRTPEDLMKVLAGLDYYWYHISGELPYEPQPELYGDPTNTDLMWMFTPEPLTDEFFDRVRLWSAELQRCVPPSAVS